MTQAQNLADLSQLYTATALANRNLIVDGAFDSWTSSSAALGTIWNYSPATMWIASAGAGGAATVSQTPIPANPVQAMLDSGPINAYSHNQTTASTGTMAARTLPSIVQNLEGVQRFAGRSVTFSCKLWAPNGNMTIPGIAATQMFGAGGSASVVLDKTVNWLVTPGNPQKFSVRLDLPNVFSTTINAGNCLTIGIWIPSGWTGYLYASEFQLEYSPAGCSSDLNGKGGLPTTFEYRGAGPELARVQRYYAKSYDSATSPGTPTVNGAIEQYVTSGIGSYQMRGSVFPTAMRIGPACAVFSQVTGASGQVAAVAANADKAATMELQGQTGFNLYAALAGADLVRFHWVADARL